MLWVGLERLPKGVQRGLLVAQKLFGSAEARIGFSPHRARVKGLFKVGPGPIGLIQAQIELTQLCRYLPGADTQLEGALIVFRRTCVFILGGIQVGQHDVKISPVGVRSKARFQGLNGFFDGLAIEKMFDESQPQIRIFGCLDEGHPIEIFRFCCLVQGFEHVAKWQGNLVERDAIRLGGKERIPRQGKAAQCFIRGAQVSMYRRAIGKGLARRFQMDACIVELMGL